MKKQFSYAFVYQRHNGGNVENKICHGILLADEADDIDGATGFVLNMLSAETKGYNLHMHSVIEIEPVPEPEVVYGNVDLLEWEKRMDEVWGPGSPPIKLPGVLGDIPESD